MAHARYSAGLWTWGKLGDRFTLEGYRPGVSPVEGIKQARNVPNLHGLELTYPDNVNEENVGEVQRALQEAGLSVSSVYCNLSSHPRWQRGAFTSTPELRAQALDQLKRTMDISKQVGANRVTFSLLQDGFDYAFQQDYLRARDLIVETLREAADHDPSVKIGVEYKAREPRVFCFIASTPSTLLLVQEIDRPNVGVTIDVGHALMIKENMAESVALLSRYGKLFHTHLNDNYGQWDDDLMVGSVHFVDTLELVYWLRRVRYDGWWGLDIFPYREDPVRACAESIAMLETCHEIIDRIGEQRISELIAAGDPTITLRALREAAFGK